MSLIDEERKIDLKDLGEAVFGGSSIWGQGPGGGLKNENAAILGGFKLTDEQIMA